MGKGLTNRWLPLATDCRFARAIPLESYPTLQCACHKPQRKFLFTQMAANFLGKYRNNIATPIVILNLRSAVVGLHDEPNPYITATIHKVQTFAMD